MNLQMRLFAIGSFLLLCACGKQQPADCSRFVAVMKPVFERYDANKDGRIDRQEYRDVINKLPRSGEGAGGLYPDDPAQTDRDFNDLDKDHDQSLTFGEFTGSVCKEGE